MPSLNLLCSSDNDVALHFRPCLALPCLALPCLPRPMSRVFSSRLSWPVWSAVRRRAPWWRWTCGWTACECTTTQKIKSLARHASANPNPFIPPSLEQGMVELPARRPFSGTPPPCLERSDLTVSAPALKESLEFSRCRYRYRHRWVTAPPGGVDGGRKKGRHRRGHLDFLCVLLFLTVCRPGSNGYGCTPTLL